MATKPSPGNIAPRLALAERIAVEAGKLGLEYFSRIGSLTVTSKGHRVTVQVVRRELCESD